MGRQWQECANTGRSSTARRTGQVDSKRPLWTNALETQLRPYNDRAERLKCDHVGVGYAPRHIAKAALTASDPLRDAPIVA